MQAKLDSLCVGEAEEKLPRGFGEQRFHQGGSGDVYDYDSASRLKQVWYGASNPPSGPAGSATHFQATLDPLENRLSTSTNGALTNYNTPDALHRYTSVGGVSRVYDLKGNLKDDGSYLFDYDAWNRLTKVRLKSNNAELSRYEYDAMGRRARKIEGTKISKYTYSGPRLLRRFEDPGSGTFSLKESYLYGAGLDELLAMDSGDQRYFVHQDALGSTAAITGSGGGVVERYRYDAYGNPTVTDASGAPIVGANGLPRSAIGNEIWFAGARFDQESGYYHMRARQYEPRTGRFTSRDPLGYVDGPNPYTYCNSDPLNWRDPFGFDKGGQDQSGEGWFDSPGAFFSNLGSSIGSGASWAGRGIKNGAIATWETLPYIPGALWDQMKSGETLSSLAGLGDSVSNGLSFGAFGELGWQFGPVNGFNRSYGIGSGLGQGGLVVGGGITFAFGGGALLGAGGGSMALAGSSGGALAVSSVITAEQAAALAQMGAGALAMTGSAMSGGASREHRDGGDSGRECRKGNDGGTRNPAQDRKLTNGEIQKLKDNGIDPEGLKGEYGIGSRGDLFKDPRTGEIFIKPKNGAGPGIPTGINVSNL